MKLLIALVSCLLLATTGVAAERKNTFENIASGLRLEKPAGWRFATVDEVAQNRANARLNDEELQKLVQQQASNPLVVAMKHDHPYDGLNPTFQVILRPLGASLASATPKRILEMLLPTLEKAYADFKLEAPIREFTLSGHPAAESIAVYTVRNQEGGVFPTRGRMIVVPRGPILFLMSASAPPDGPDRSTDEFDAVLKSIVIAD